MRKPDSDPLNIPATVEAMVPGGTQWHGLMYIGGGPNRPEKWITAAR